VLTAICAYTRLVYLKGLKTKTREEVARGLVTCFWEMGTFPRVLHSDRGTEFVNVLLTEVLAILEKARALAGDPMPGDYVFPSHDAKGDPAPLSLMAMGMLLRGMCFDGLKPEAPARWRDHEGRAVTVHGFRSSFKEWSIAAGMPDHLSELALAHAERKKTRAAYARLDQLETRRLLMEKWAVSVVKSFETTLRAG
jgi:integrase